MWKYNKTEDLPGDSLYHSADELYHYGIPGMRWRHRKAQLIEMRKQKANQRIVNLKNKGANINKINKAKNKANKINRSRYGQTRTQIIGKGILKSMAANVISSSASKVAKSYGRDDIASIIRIANSGYNTANAVKTGYRAITNYNPSNRKAQINKSKNKKSKHMLRKAINSTIKTAASVGMGGYNNKTISNAKKTANYATLTKNMSPEYKRRFMNE